MKKALFFTPCLFSSVLLTESFATQRIIETYWANIQNSSEKNTVLLDHNNALITFRGEGILEGQLVQRYRMWISRFYSQDELSQEEKESFYGYFLQCLDQQALEDQEIAIDDYTSCLAKDGGYECTTLVAKAWVAKQLQKGKE